MISALFCLKIEIFWEKNSKLFLIKVFLENIFENSFFFASYIFSICVVNNTAANIKFCKTYLRCSAKKAKTFLKKELTNK